MRHRRSTGLIVMALALAACGDETGLEAADLQGTWNATIYEYTDDANPASVVDIVVRDDASFTMSVDATGTASTLFDDGVGGSSSDSGTLDSTGTVLTLGGVAFDADRRGDVLTLMDTDAEFDFGSGSAVPATLRIVLNRE